MDCACRVLPLLQFGGGKFPVVRPIIRYGSGGSFFCFFCPLPGTFLGLALDMGSDKLHDFVQDIPDVMGLRALRPSVAILKVMSVPDS